MFRSVVSFVSVGALALTLLLHPDGTSAQTRRYTLESTAGLRLVNVNAAPATLDGKKGLRVTMLADAVAQSERIQRAAQGQAGPTDQALIPDQLVVIEGLDFANGVIEAEIAGTPAAGAPEGARGFVGLAFRLRDDKTYDALYLRPTNGRVEDQVRRNHAVQYISHPDWPWYRLRKETPSRYESYVDLVPSAWTKVKIDVRGSQARLYVHGQEHPTLIVNDLKTGTQGKGAIALWLGNGTVAHFRNLSVTP